MKYTLVSGEGKGMPGQQYVISDEQCIDLNQETLEISS